MTAVSPHMQQHEPKVSCPFPMPFRIRKQRPCCVQEPLAIVLPLLRSRGCHVYVATRAADHQRQATQMGAVWVGGTFDAPPQPLDAAITFAPSGQVVVAALAATAKGGIVAINAVHLDCIPEFSYDNLLWGERQLRSVASVTIAHVRGGGACTPHTASTPRSRDEAQRCE